MNNKSMKLELTNANTQLFLSVMRNFGFEESYIEILSGKSDMDKQRILTQVMDSFAIMSSRDYTIYQIKNAIPQIINSNHIDEKYKTYLASQHFAKTYGNYVIEENLKIKKILELINSLSNFSLYKAEFGEIHMKSVLYFYKDFILLNPDSERQKLLFEELIHSLFIHNQYTKSDFYIATISELFLSLYIYTYYESDMLKKEHVSKLESLLKTNVGNTSNVRISLSRLIEDEIVEVLGYYLKRLFSGNLHDWVFDYYPEGSGVRAGEVPENKFSRIFIALASLFGYGFNIASEYDKYFSLATNDTISQICFSSIICFDNRTKKLNTDSEKDQMRFSKLFSQTSSLPLNYLYDTINIKLKNIRHTKNPIVNNGIDIKEINTEIHNYLSSEALDEFNPSLPFKEPDRFYINPVIINKQLLTNDFTIDTFTGQIETYLWQMLNKTLPTLKISIDTTGLTELKNALDKYKIKITNFVLDLEYVFRAEIKSTQEYTDLKDALDKIKLHKIFGSYNTFLNSDNFQFNLEVISCETRPLTFEETEKWIHSHKIADGVYELEFTTFNYSEMKEYSDKNMIVRTIFFNLATNTTNTSGFEIEYKFT